MKTEVKVRVAWPYEKEGLEPPKPARGEDGFTPRASGGSSALLMP